jgi:hypothetical protein
MGRALALLINGRDRGFQLEAPRCQKCSQPMEFEGYRGWTIYGLEGDTRLERAYYVCPTWPGRRFYPWIRNCGCGRITGVRGQRGSQRDRGCRRGRLT